MTCTIKFSGKASELEATLPLTDIEKRYLARLRSSKTAVASGSAEGRVSASAFLKYLLADAKVEPVAVIDAMTDLMEAGIIELYVPDAALFRDQMTVVVAELEAEAQIR